MFFATPDVDPKVAYREASKRFVTDEFEIRGVKKLRISDPVLRISMETDARNYALLRWRFRDAWINHVSLHGFS